MPHAGGLWYEWHGPEDGEVLILSAGLGGAGAYWTPNLPAFAERYRVLLYDHRGTGRSDKLPPGPTSVEAMAADVRMLMDALEIPRAALVGHALGGLIGLALGAAAPDRLEKLVVVNGWARLDPYTARCFDVRLAMLRDSGPDVYVRAQPIFLYPPHWISVHSDRLDQEAAVQLAHFPDIATVERRVLATRGFEAAPLLARIDTPVLVLATADDALVPAHCARDLAEGLPRVTRVLQFSGGHASNVTEPDGFNRLVLDFLGS